MPVNLKTYGRAVDLPGYAVARVTTRLLDDQSTKADCVYVCDTLPEDSGQLAGYRALLTTSRIKEAGGTYGSAPLPTVHSAKDVSHLRDGDVVLINPKTGLVRTLYRQASKQNVLFMTERCNSFCLMCSQPPVDRVDNERIAINFEVLRLIEAPEQLGLTGGEPTLLGDGLFEILRTIRERFPDTRVHMLTNGRRFAQPDFTRGFVVAASRRTSLGIPLYSDTAWEHDYVVQAEHAFDQTIQGLYLLARYDWPVEIRIVLHALSVPRLLDLCYYVYRNLPFASHIALMGLEITGFTRPNLGKLWIDPYDYRDELAKAVEFLAVRGMNVSVYNLQLCVIPRPIWKFARQSISDWKNIYFDECAKCSVREQCGGLFASATRRHSTHIQAI
jgi:His-Xaa-Ser system radical SAM maturase HxsC